MFCAKQTKRFQLEDDARHGEAQHGKARLSTARHDARGDCNCNCNYNPEWSAQWHLKWSVCRPIRTLVLAAQLNCRGEGSTNRSRVADWGGGANPSRPSRRTNHQNRHAEWTHHHAMRACRLGSASGWWECGVGSLSAGQRYATQYPNTIRYTAIEINGTTTEL